MTRAPHRSDLTPSPLSPLAEGGMRPPTYRVEHQIGEAVVIVAGPLSYLQALRPTVTYAANLDHRGRKGQLRVVEESFGTTVAGRSLESARARATTPAVEDPTGA